MTVPYYISDMMNKRYWDTLPKRLKLVREDRGLTQAEVVERVKQHGVEFQESFLSRVEGGTRTLSPEQLSALARVYNVSTDFLLCLTDTERPLDGVEDYYWSPEADEIARLVDDVRDRAERARLVHMMRDYIGQLSMTESEIDAESERLLSQLNPEMRAHVLLLLARLIRSNRPGSDFHFQ